MSEGSYGSFNICEVCGWEDDDAQLANPACGGGANYGSLIEAQAAALRLHPLNKVEVGGFIRDRTWRPLQREEINRAERERREKRWKNTPILEAREAYWLNGA